MSQTNEAGERHEFRGHADALVHELKVHTAPSETKSPEEQRIEGTICGNNLRIRGYWDGSKAPDGSKVYKDADGVTWSQWDVEFKPDDPKATLPAEPSVAPDVGLLERERLQSQADALDIGESSPPQDNYDSMSFAELFALATERGLNFDLIACLRALDSIGSETRGEVTRIEGGTVYVTAVDPRGERCVECGCINKGRMEYCHCGHKCTTFEPVDCEA